MNKNIRTTLIILLLMISGLLGLFFSLIQHKQNSAVKVHYPTDFVKQLAHDPKAGEKVFQMFCANCHGKNPVIDVNAPQIGDQKAWKIRAQQGMPQLLQLTIMGMGAMPARGGCFECDDELLKQTIDYMLKNSGISSH